MILILNCLLEEKSVGIFNEAMGEYFRNLFIKYEIFRIKEADKISSLNKYTHLIISGSGASAVDGNSWDSILEEIVMHFVNNKKAILGICYGHQFLVKVLAGVNHIRKANIEEIGFVNVDIDNNELFEGIVDPVFCVAHHEEVFDLNEDFNIIARNRNCSVHGFQYKDLPVWGIQFHPEYSIKNVEDMINECREKDLNFEKYFVYDLKNDDKILQNKLIFKNFATIGSTPLVDLNK